MNFSAPVVSALARATTCRKTNFKDDAALCARLRVHLLLKHHVHLVLDTTHGEVGELCKVIISLLKNLLVFLRKVDPLPKADIE